MKTAYLYANPVVNRDAAVYIAAAQKFSAGQYSEMLQHYPMPVYPVLLALVHALVPDWILAGRLLSTIPLVLCILPLYLLSARLFGRSSAIAAAMLFAVLPVFNEAATEIIRDPLFLFLSLLSLALVAESIYRNYLLVFAAGMACAVFGALVRIEGIALLVLLPALYLWHVQPQLNKRSLLRIIMFFLSPFVLLGLVLWGFAELGLESMSRIPEAFIWIRGLLTFNLFDNYQALQETLKAFEQQTPGAGFRNNLIETARHYAPIVYILGLAEILVKGIFPTSLIALWGLRYRHRGAQHIANSTSTALLSWPWGMFVILNLLFCLAYNFTTTRYMWIPIVLTLPTVGLGICILWQRFHKRLAPVVFLTIMFFVAPALKSVSDVPESDTVIKEAGQWILRNDPEQKHNVLFNDRRLALYTDRLDSKNFINVSETPNSEELQRFPGDNFAVVIKHNVLRDMPPPGFVELARFSNESDAVVIIRRQSTPGQDADR